MSLGGLDLIDVGGKNYQYVIYSVSPERILTGQYALIKQNIDLARWLLSIGVTPDEETAMFAQYDFSLLKQLVEQGIRPSSLEISLQNGYLDVLDYLTSKGIYKIRHFSDKSN